MDDVVTTITQIGELVKSQAWIPLASLVIGLLVRLSKRDKFAAWFPVNLDPKYRAWAALGLGVVSGVLDAVVGGASWPTAIVGGIVSSLTAISAHQLVVESARDGRDLFVPKNESGGGPPAGSRKAQPSGYSVKCAALVFAVMLLLVGCESCKRNADGTTSPIDCGKLVKCAPNAGDLIGTVTEILLTKAAPDNPLKLSPAGQDELSRLARQHGASAVLCAVETLWRDWSNPSMAAVAPYRGPAAARARAFLDSTGATVQRDE